MIASYYMQKTNVTYNRSVIISVDIYAEMKREEARRVMKRRIFDGYGSCAYYWLFSRAVAVLRELAESGLLECPDEGCRLRILK